MSRNAKIVRGIIGLVILVALIVLVNSWYRQFRTAPKAESRVATATVAATSTTAPAPANNTVVLVLIDGLNFRVKPDATGTSLRGLKKGEKLVVVGKTGTWLHVQDNSGAVGWVVYNPQYLRVSKGK